jgi:VanZ family protein
VTSALAPRGVLSRLAFGAVVLISLVVLFAPGRDVPPSPHGIDKLVHGGLFLALAVSGSWAGIRRGALAVLLLVYAGGSELIQTIPALQRDGSIADWFADAIGVLLGLLVWVSITRPRRP